MCFLNLLILFQMIEAFNFIVEMSRPGEMAEALSLLSSTARKRERKKETRRRRMQRLNQRGLRMFVL